MDENEYVTVCAGDGGADGSTDDGSGLATIDDCELAIITAGGIVTGDAVVGIGGDALFDDDATLAVDVAPVDDGILVPIMVPMLVVDADGAAVDDAAGASDAVDGAPPVDDGIMVPLSAVVANGATVDDGIMIPMLVGGAGGATVDGRISVDDTNGVSIDEGSIDGAGGATVDDGSVDDADGAPIDEAISGGGELELLALVPIGGGVVDAVASIVPVGAGTC